MSLVAYDDSYFRPVDEVVELWRHRRLSREPWLNDAESIKDAYNGAMPMPYSDSIIGAKPGTPNFIFGGIDNNARRLASVSANVNCPAPRPGQDLSEKRARERRKAILGWWKHNDIRISDYRRARWYIGYGCAPTILRPGPKSLPEPRWHDSDPLSCFPAPTERFDDPEPDDCIFAYKRTYGWLKRYPGAYDALHRKGCSDNDQILLLEYADAYEDSLIVISEKVSEDQPMSQAYPGYTGSGNYMALDRTVNRSNLCQAVVPGCINLDRTRTGYADAVGMSMAHNLLFALELEAVFEDIWQREWIISPAGSPEPVVQVPDARKGQPGKISGGDIKVVRQPPGYMTNPTRDYLERGIKLTTGQPSESYGEAATNVRTGKRGEQLISAVVEFPIAEAHEIFARAKEAELRRAIAIAKGYFGNAPRSFYVGRSVGYTDYTPNKTFETDDVEVFYSLAGVDAQNQTIMLGQLMGTGMISTRSAMEMHPFIDDAEQEHDRVQAEALSRAGFAAIQTQAEQGMIVPGDLARIAELIESDRMEWWEAVTQVQKEAQERQSPNVAPVEPGSPEAQAGLAQPGMGGESASAIPPPSSGQEAISNALSTLYPVQAAMR